MSLRKARRILTILLSVLIVIGGNLFFGAEIAEYTFCNQNYMTKVFSSDTFNEKCELNFKDRTAVLSAESDIPPRVFEAILDNNSFASKTAVQRLFDGYDSSLYNDDLIEQFETLCLEYLDGNKIAYDKSKIHNTAVAATEIYSDSFGISNSQEAIAFIDNVNSQHSKFASIGLLLIAISIALFLIIFTKKSDIIRAVCSAFTALGLSMLLTGICSLIFGVGDIRLLSPVHYAESLSTAVDGAFAVAIVVGLLITAASVAGSVSQYKLSVKNME